MSSNFRIVLDSWFFQWLILMTQIQPDPYNEFYQGYTPRKWLIMLLLLLLLMIMIPTDAENSKIWIEQIYGNYHRIIWGQYSLTSSTNTAASYTKNLSHVPSWIYWRRRQSLFCPSILTHHLLFLEGGIDTVLDFRTQRGKRKPSNI